MHLRIIITGGTFDKRYDAIRGQMTFKDSHLPEIVQFVRCGFPVELEINQLTDSLDMDDSNRQSVLDACVRASESHIVITHGTDTMQDTAAFLGRSIERLSGKRIVFTGAMVPYSVSDSDALFNLGCAVAAVQFVVPGVYIAMNGRTFRWDQVRKDRQRGQFEGNPVTG